MLDDGFEYITVKSNEQFENLVDNGNFCRVYYDCFHIEIYSYENPSFNEVKTVLKNYFETGILMVCINNKGKVVGFVASQPLTSSDERVLSIAQKFGFDPMADWYHAELGVAEEYRRHGIGKKLVTKILELTPANRIIMRTQEKNMPSISLHTEIGFKVVDGMTYFHSSSTDKRIFLSYDKL